MSKYDIIGSCFCLLAMFLVGCCMFWYFVVKPVRDISRLQEDVKYLMDCEMHQAQIDTIFMQRIDYLLEEASYPGGELSMDPGMEKLLIYRGKD